MAGETGTPTAEDREFMEQLYETHRGIMYKVASASLSDPAEADDAVSEALLRLFRRAALLRTLSRKQLVDYVATTVYSVAVDHERRRSTERRLFVSADSMALAGEREPTVLDVEEEFTDREKHAALLRYLREALDELSDADRALLIAKYVDGESDAALARRQGVKAGSVRMKLTRARRRARALIERKEAEDEKRKHQR